MALADLLRAIEAEANEELAAREAASRAEAAAIVERAERDAERLEEEIAAEAARAAEPEAERIRSAARLDARRTTERELESAIAATRGALVERLDGLRESEEYPEALGHLIAEALERLPEATTAAVDPADRELVAGILAERGRELTVQGSLRTAGGVVLSDGDGRLIDNTVEARLRAYQPELRRRVAVATRGA